MPVVTQEVPAGANDAAIPHQAFASGRQPYLHLLVTAVRAPVICVSRDDGQLRPSGVIGLYASDRRALSRLVVLVGGEEPAPVLGQALGGPLARFSGIARSVGDPTPDPTVLLERRREVTGDGMVERLSLRSTAQTHVTTAMTIDLECDLVALETVKVGHGGSDPLKPVLTSSGLRWQDDGTSVELTWAPPPTSVDEGPISVATWEADLDHGDQLDIMLSVRVTDVDRGPAAFEAAVVRPWEPPVVVADDRRLPSLVSQSLDDLAGLVLRDEDAPFLAAGSPWFLTLFGRDSLWAARMLLPLGTALPLGTLHTLARRQGEVVDHSTEEEPGKILHEVRREELVVDNVSLPPVYYGTVDATPLWVCLLVETWLWGAPASAIEPLLPAAERALEWMAAHGDSDGDGFLEYVDHRGGGLSNQGWKDSSDSIQWADGRLADGPLALCEVQGYAYEAAVGGAALLDAFGRPGGDRWRAWADRLAAEFRARFWVEDTEGRYPAVALDAAKQRVDSIASNMGHLLGTGLLDPGEEALVAERLTGSHMDSGFGLRTLTSRSPRFSALSYHGGAVWPHDTAVAVSGLTKAGHGALAVSFVDGLLAAATGFEYRLPELFGGGQRVSGESAVPYPAACRPQAWSAASSIALLSSLLGLQVDVPGGVISLSPTRPSPVGAIEVHGLRVGSGHLDVAMTADGTVTVLAVPPELSVVLH